MHALIPLLPLLAMLAADAAPATPPLPFEAAMRRGLACLRTWDLPCAERDLRRAVDVAPAPREAAKARLLLAQAMDEAGRPGEALESLGAAVDLPPVLAEAAAFTAAEAKVHARDPGAPEALRAFLIDHPHSTRGAEARLHLAELAVSAGDPAGATKLAEDLLAGRPGRGDRARALGVLARAAPEPRRAEARRTLFLDLPDTGPAAATGLKESDLTPAERETRAAAYFDAMDFEEAQRIRTALWEDGLRSPKLAHVLGLSHLVHTRDDSRKALEYFEIAKKGGAITPLQAHLLMARTRAKLEQYDRAEAHYRAFLDGGGKGEGRVQALYYLAWLPYDHGDWKRALPRLDRFLKQVPKHELRSYLVWAKGWSLYQLKRYRDAIAVFRDMKKLGNNLVAGKAMYWGGMAWRALGDRAEAAKWMREAIDRYPLSWYAVLAAKRLDAWDGTPLPHWITGPSPGLPDPAPYWPYDRLPADLAADLREVQDLADVGEIDRARSRWRSLQPAVDKHLPPGEDRARALGTIHDAVEDYNRLYKLATNDFGRRMGAVPTPSNAVFWMAAYPRAGRSLAEVLAPRFALPEHWIYAIMRQESRYDARQVSWTAALGLMQMIPKTARIVSKALGVPFQLETFFSPGHNLLFCTYYLGALLADFKGQIVFASMAYNGGAPAIKRFLREHRGKPFDEMVEFVAYNESRNYGRKVAEHLTRYAWLHLDAGERARLYAKLFPDSVDYDLGTDVDY